MINCRLITPQSLNPHKNLRPDEPFSTETPVCRPDENPTSDFKITTASLNLFL